MEQRANGTLRYLGGARSRTLRVPKLFNLRRDPYERADITSNTFYDWALVAGLASSSRLRPMSASSCETFERFPPRQKPASFSVGGQMEALEKALARLNGDID